MALRKAGPCGLSHLNATHLRDISRALIWQWIRITVDVHNALSLLTTRRASEYLSFVPQVSEIVIGFRSFRQRREPAAIWAGRSLFLAKTSRLSLAILHKSHPNDRSMKAVRTAGEPTSSRRLDSPNGNAPGLSRRVRVAGTSWQAAS